ncbi:hypothetical protein ACGFY3_07085 [Streptomyces mirabilis]|uniref:hypothetical protein n=1 Tax=Streptomyces mirabilis TaxID=68239 RepID=UPI00371FBC20
MITHQEWNAVKIGIGIGACTGYTSRLTQHERQGRQLHQVRDYPTGAAAQNVEQAVLGRLRAAGLAPFLTRDIQGCSERNNARVPTRNAPQVSRHPGGCASARCGMRRHER